MSQTSAKPVPKKQRDMNKKPSKSAVVIPAALLAILALAAFFLFALPFACRFFPAFFRHFPCFLCFRAFLRPFRLCLVPFPCIPFRAWGSFLGFFCLPCFWLFHCFHFLLFCHIFSPFSYSGFGIRYSFQVSECGAFFIISGL